MRLDAGRHLFEDWYNYVHGDISPFDLGNDLDSEDTIGHSNDL